MKNASDSVYPKDVSAAPLVAPRLSNNPSYDYEDLSRHLLAYEVWLAWPVFVGITAVGLIGNLLVVVAIVGSTPMMRSTMNRLLLNLAVGDFTNLLSCTAQWVQILTNHCPQWSLPDWTCPLVAYITEVSLYSSLMFQIAVSTERYMAISRPLHVRHILTHSKVRTVVASVWTLSLAFALPYLFRFVVKQLPFPPHFVCTYVSPMPVSFKIAEFLSFYLGPLVFLAVIYGKSARLLWANPEYLRQSIRLSGGKALGLARIRGRRRVLLMLSCCGAIYFVCFSPIQAVFLTSLLVRTPTIDRYSVYLVMNTLIYSSSACNPILYSLFSTRFRCRFLQLLCRFRLFSRLLGVHHESAKPFYTFKRDLKTHAEVKGAATSAALFRPLLPMVGGGAKKTSVLMPVVTSAPVDDITTEGERSFITVEDDDVVKIPTMQSQKQLEDVIELNDDDDVPITAARSGFTPLLSKKSDSSPNFSGKTIRAARKATHTPVCIRYSTKNGAAKMSIRNEPRVQPPNPLIRPAARPRQKMSMVDWFRH